MILHPFLGTDRALAAILLFALLLRVVFFVGLASGDPQDDGIYYNNALALSRDGPKYLELFENLATDVPVNPVASFHLRPMVTYPIAAIFVTFGPSEISAALWGLACSLLTVVVAYRLGAATHDRVVGLLAAWLCAIYPLEVITATRILSDVQVGLFCGLGLLLLVEAGNRRSVWLYALSGAAVAGACLANLRGLVFLVALVAGAVLQRFTGERRGLRSAPLWIVIGFCSVLSIEALTYFVTTVDPLLSYRVARGVIQFKYSAEPVTNIDWGPVRVSYTNGRPFELVRSVLHIDRGPKDQFGLFYFIFFAAVVFGILRRRAPLLVALAVGLCLYLEFGPAAIAVDWAGRTVRYMMVFKQERFLLMITVLVVVLSADLLRSIARRSRLIAIGVVLLLLVSSLSAVAHTHRFYRAGLSDLRAAARYVQANPGRTFYGDLWAVEHIRIFTRDQAHNLRILDVRTPLADIKGACIMLGGSRGVELLADYVESTLPPFARDALATGSTPPAWTLVQKLTAAHNHQRTHDFSIYCSD